MKHPTKQQMLEVIETLEMTAGKYPKPKHLDMYTASIYPERTAPECGTIFCFAGGYGLGLVLQGKATIQEIKQHSSCDQWIWAANRMAETLGFDNYRKLQTWTYNNPKKWLNDSGLYLFYTPKAFTSPSRPNGARSFRGIIAHLKLVTKTLPEATK